VDECLLAIADRVYESTTFELAYDADTRRSRLARGGYLVSAKLNEQLKLDAMYERRASGLLWRAWS
jgi:hypothetical protein